LSLANVQWCIAQIVFSFAYVYYEDDYVSARPAQVNVELRGQVDGIPGVMATTVQTNPSVVLRDMRGIRVVLCDPDEEVRAGLRTIIEADPLLTVVGETADWLTCENEVENLVPELLIVRADLIPDEWAERSAEDTFAPIVLPVSSRDWTGKGGRIGLPFEPRAIRTSLNQVVTEIYDRKAKQLLYLVGHYVAASEVANRYETVIRVEHEDQNVEVPIEAVIAVVAARKHVIVQTSGGKNLLREPIHRVVETLDPSIFVRIHRSVIVNFSHMDLRATTSKSSQVVMKDGSRYPIGRNYRDALAAQLQRLDKVA
jgi:DNA-binding LytR/AlgR family response regulator